MEDNRPVLVTGATGYVGGRLVPNLLERGHRVRAMGRSASKLGCRPWASHDNVELTEGDMFDEESLFRAAAGCRAAYYLVHSMLPGKKDFASLDREAASNFASAARRAGMERIIYLGGLGEDDENLSEHLRSRLEVAKILRASGVPTTFLRAAMILGSGSASFEIMRYLVDRLPVMLTPRWVRTPVEPISIRNVLGYLAGCLEKKETAGQTYEIGGGEVVTYHRLFDIYAQEAGLEKRFIIPVPVLSPRLSSYWIHLVTPVHAQIARPLAEGLGNEVVCRDTRIRKIIPQELLDCRQAIRLALDRIARQKVATCWTDAGFVCAPEWGQPWDARYAGGTVKELGFRVVIAGGPEEAWEPISRMGGDTGYYFWDRLWRVRGMLDRLLGGAGLRRGRRHPAELYVGDALDFWRVVEVEPEKRLMLAAEMRLPGEATLEFTLEERDGGSTEVRQVSRFLPRGLLGMAYWRLTGPIHERLFKGMLKSLAAASKRPVVSGPEPFDPRAEAECAI